MDNCFIKIKLREKQNILIFASGSGINFQCLIDSCNNGTIHGKIIGLIYNKANTPCKNLAEFMNIPHYYKPFLKNIDYDSQLANFIIQLKEKPNLIILTGWIHVFSTVFLKIINHIGIKIINLHPVLSTVSDVWNNSLCKYSSIMVHEITPNIDDDKIYYKMIIHKLPTDSFNTFKDRMTYFEKSVLIQGTISALAELDF